MVYFIYWKTTFFTILEQQQPKRMSVKELLEEGARCMAEKKYEEAVGIYSEACQMSNLEHGKDDPDLMYLYGKALFENAVQSSDVLGVGKGNDEDKDIKDDKDDKNKDEEKGGFQFNDKLAEDEDDEEDQDEEEEDQNNSSDEEVVEENNENEQSDFEIAWEILDLTRLLYKDQLKDIKDIKKEEIQIQTNNEEFNKYLRLSEVYMLMGDISLENENFPQSIEDYEKGNEILEKLFNETNGRRHEAMFKLSLAYEFIGDDKGLNKSIECMRKVLKMVKDNNKDNEIKLEIQTRLEDLVTLQKQRNAEKEQLKGLLTNVQRSSSSSTANNIDTTSARDLSSFVKKKKKKKNLVVDGGKIKKNA